VLNGTERLGVAHVVLPAGTDPHGKWVREQCWTLAGLIGYLVISKLHYSDLFHVVRRTEPLSVASELLWQLLPPQTFACERLVVTAMVEPYDQVGGTATTTPSTRTAHTWRSSTRWATTCSPA
jgi:hypothetical protein